jgi:hypothetical protein
MGYGALLRSLCKNRGRAPSIDTNTSLIVIPEAACGNPGSQRPPAFVTIPCPRHGTLRRNAHGMTNLCYFVHVPPALWG